LLLAVVVALGVLTGHAAASAFAAPGAQAGVSASADELAAEIVGENLSRSFVMHVIRPTPAVQAARALMAMKDEAVPALTKVLRSADPLHRENAVYVLSRIGTLASVPPRVQATSDESPLVRAMAARDLPVWTDEAAKKAALGALKDREAVVRSAAAFAFDLRRLGRSVPVPDNTRYDAASAVVPLLEDPETRPVAAQTLKSLGCNLAARPLAKALVDDRAWVRQEVLDAIGATKDKAVTLEVLALLKDKESSVRAAASAALGQLADIRATPPLIHALSDSATYVRYKAAEALGKIGDRRAVEPLIKALEEGKDVAPAAAEALGRIGDPAAVKPLMAMLRPHHPGAEAAAAALGALRDPIAIETLRLYLMENPESQAAADALAQIPHPDSVAALISVVIAKRAHVCRYALNSLTGRSFSHESTQEIEQWWAANRASYAP
jgi:HEAT repeat protein